MDNILNLSKDVFIKKELIFQKLDWEIDICNRMLKIGRFESKYMFERVMERKTFTIELKKYLEAI